MKRINIYALKKDRKEILEELQRLGLVEIENLDIKDNIFEKEDTKQKQSVFLKSSATAGQAYEILSEYVEDESKSMLSMFEGRKQISPEDYYKYVNQSNEIMRIAHKLISLKKGIAESKSEIAKYENQVVSLEPWKDFDISMRYTGTKYTKVFIGTLPEPKTYEEILTSIALEEPEIKNFSLEIVNTDENGTYIFLICQNEDFTKMENALRNLGFSKPSVLSKYVPMERIEELKGRINKASEFIADSENQIISYKGAMHALEFIEDYYVMRSEKYDVIEKLENSKHTFILTGYVVARDYELVETALTGMFDVFIEEVEIQKNETPPVALKNNAIVQPIESVLETYSMPKKGEIDPTSAMSIFYYVFFGLMFSDAGYGLILALGCFILLKKCKNMEDGLKKSVKMFMGCGISTMFWGIMFGSYFGNAVTVIAQTFFNTELTIPPLWFDPLQGANSMTLLMTAFLFGIIHIFVALGVKAYSYILQKKYLDVIYDVLSWYLLVGGGILSILSVDMLKGMTGFMLPAPFGTIGAICMAVGAVIILIFAGRESKPTIRFLKGLYGLYGITGYLSDILSYSRLLALGLATGVIAQVFNQIGSMMGGGVIGTIVFIIVFIIGHALNIGINALGAYVHTNRLQFVEFFGKFYEGGGEKFKPFKINTKHYNIKEDFKNG